ncbi:AI-2E family transporter [Enterovirga sp.]|uniref:AI-2E family transporter n=1 Tax=Enterovirga sp. TaxID=2026350 RepID=UPI00261EC5B8|nr:AI-2E family transporter [Enterovirga sp.]MDB5592510.1 transporter [Enterovirga sp.]
MPDSYSSPRRGQVDAAAPSIGPGALITGAVIVAALYVGREVLVPFVLAVILSFVLAIPVRLLQGWGLGRVLPVTAVVLLAFLAIGGITALLVGQAAELANDLPRYQSTIRDKISALKGATAGSGPLERLGDMLQELAKDLGPQPSTAQPQTPGAPPAAAEPAPVPVEIAKTRISPLAAIAAFVAPVVKPLGTAALVIVFTVFMLMQREDLRNRAIRLAGSRDLQRTTAAMDEAAHRLSRYFLVQVLLNAAFGAVVGIGLWLIGVPSPILWGILSFVSRFVPYVGVALAAGGPLLLAAAVDPSWTMLLMAAGFFICIEFGVGQIVEPLIFGRSTGLTPLAVLGCVTFWTWLWGPVGLIIAMPLTVCLVVLGRHVEQLEFLDVMLGDRPPLTVAEVFYQRILAGDAGEAIEQAELFLKEHSLAAYYDEVAVKGLALGQVDLARGALDEAALVRIEEASTQLIEELAEHEADPPAGSPEGKKIEVKRAAGDEDLDQTLDSADAAAGELPTLPAGALGPGASDQPAVLCVAGRNGLDLVSARMLAQILEKHGLPARVESSDVLSTTGIARIATGSARIVCLSYLDTSVTVHVRFAVRRLRRRLPDALVVIGSWGLGTAEGEGLCEAARSDRCASRLTDAARICLEAAAGWTATPAGTGPYGDRPAPAKPAAGQPAGAGQPAARPLVTA